MITYALKKAVHVISVCQSLKDKMTDLGVRASKISTIPNGIDPNHFYPEDRKEARRHLGLAENGRIVLSVGALIPRKGYDYVLAAIDGMVPKLEDLQLFVIGEGPLRPFLEGKVKEMNLERHVHLVGQRPNTELRHWYNAADVLCLASSREGWANVIMESLACGTPVVATNVWGAPEILTSPDVGILVEQKARSIEEGLMKALNREWDRTEIHMHVAERTWDEVAREVKAVFDSAIEQWNQGKGSIKLA
jgi:glycosyltransferase involved in cell wall biosynthesis